VNAGGPSNAVAEPHVAASLELLGLLNGDLRSQPRDTQPRGSPHVEVAVGAMVGRNSVVRFIR